LARRNQQQEKEMAQLREEKTAREKEMEGRRGMFFVLV
jgi:hypothetical protein